MKIGSPRPANGVVLAGQLLPLLFGSGFAGLGRAFSSFDSLLRRARRVSAALCDTAPGDWGAVLRRVRRCGPCGLAGCCDSESDNRPSTVSGFARGWMNGAGLAPGPGMHSRLSPFGALLCGVAAGVVGSYAQSVFFRVTQRITPKNPPDVFEKPEPQQDDENATQTVARRVVEGLALRGPIEHKQVAAEAVHYAFGGAGGGLYGLLAASFSEVCSLRGGLVFGTGVWMVSDNLILPGFRLAAWPGAYPVNSHVYAVGAHLVYGGLVYATFAALEKLASRRAVALLGAYWIGRKVWTPLRPFVRRSAQPAIRYTLMARDVAHAIQA